jgi:hypothetical protein
MGYVHFYHAALRVLISSPLQTLCGDSFIRRKKTLLWKYPQERWYAKPENTQQMRR